VFRPPYGAVDLAVVRDAATLGLATVTWDVDPRDWSLPGRGKIAAAVLRETRPGSIILMHDGGGPREQTIRALPAIVRALRARGLRFVTVPQLLEFAPRYAG
jgi:peptidoglycan/xylan/chitin deacetylase (PgdA/CDA1 family)